MGGLSWRVLKFGGTSVGTQAPLRSALAISTAAAREARVAIVVSALSGVTNALEAALAGAAAGRLDAARFAAALGERHLALLKPLAHGKPAARATKAVRAQLDELALQLQAVAQARNFSPAARASVLASGERLSVPVFAAALSTLGLDAVPIDAAALVRTDDAFAEATIDRTTTRRLVRAAFDGLAPAAVPVVTGFVGGTAAGRTTLLGRGASDLTAAILGEALEAERVFIWSDVDGVMNADPRLVPSASTLPRLTYAEADALARSGAKILHPRTLEPLAPAGIPVFVGNTLRPDGPGTWIGPRPLLDALATEDDQAGTAA